MYGYFMGVVALARNGYGIIKVYSTTPLLIRSLHGPQRALYPSSLPLSKVPPWSLESSWGANGFLPRFDNVIMALWTLYQVQKQGYLYSRVGWVLMWIWTRIGMLSDVIGVRGS